MPSTYTTRIRLEDQGDGENANTWGQKVDQNFILIDEALEGYLEVDVAGSSNVTLTANNAATDQSRQRVLKLTGAITADIDVICPAVEKNYIVWNATSGNFDLTFKPSGGTGLIVPQDFAGRVFTDGSTMYRAGPWIVPATGRVQLDTAGTSRADATRLHQVQDSGPTWGGTSGGTANALTISLTPSFANANYAAGLSIDFIAGATTTATDPTIDIDSVGPATIKGEDGADLPVGAIQQGRTYRITHDGTNFLLREVRETLGAVQTASGTAVDFTGIPSNARQITVGLSGLSSNGTATFLVQIGTSGGIEATGYNSIRGQIASTTSSTATATTGFQVAQPSAGGSTIRGQMVLTLVDPSINLWTFSGVFSEASPAVIITYASGSKALSAVLDRVRITADGVDTFDAGTINVLVS